MGGEKTRVREMIEPCFSRRRKESLRKVPVKKKNRTTGRGERRKSVKGQGYPARSQMQNDPIKMREKFKKGVIIRRRKSRTFNGLLKIIAIRFRGVRFNEGQVLTQKEGSFGWAGGSPKKTETTTKTRRGP